MAAGWRLPNGEITKYFVEENELWSTFNFVFSEACAKQSTYKFGLIKSILDNLLSVVKSDRGMELSYRDIFAKFAENYWNLITKYNLRQIRTHARYSASEIEKIFQAALQRSQIVGEVEFANLAEKDRESVISAVTRECKRCVVGALYADFEGYLYGFSLKGDGIWINPVAYEFMLKYKPEIEQLNYYSWAKFLEKVNSDEVLVRVLGKLELATPRRMDLSIYRKLLQEEFEDNTCFYCGCKLKGAPHVDHVIPWSFVKEDHLWNFVLACPTCNTKKNNKLPTKSGLSRVIVRNDQLIQIASPKIELAFKGYSPDLLWRIWGYAKLSGIREFASKE
jgi:hypothetical protein